MVPTVATSEEIRPPLSHDLLFKIRDGDSNYMEIIDSGREDWLTNMDRLKSIFYWGVALGKLIHVVDENPKEAETILRDSRLVQGELSKFYEEKKAILKFDTIKKGFEIIPEESNEIMKQLLLLHAHVDRDMEMHFQTLYSKYSIAIDIQRIPEMFPASELEKATVLNTAVFYIYNLAILSMFRRGLQEGIAKSESQKIDLVMNEELLHLYVALDSTFKKLEERINKN